MINRSYQGWAYLCNRKWDHLVIDGNNVCYGLHKESSWFGGEYGKYRDYVRKHFQKLQARFGKLVVVFDGSRPELKMKTVFERRKSALVGMCDVQKREMWDASERNYGSPHFIMSVFMEVMRGIESIEIIFTNGEADGAVAALANHHQCPVLASDSDYFILELKHGFIQLSDWLHVVDSHNPNIENIQMFNMRNLTFRDRGSFSLSEYDQCLETI